MSLFTKLFGLGESDHYNKGIEYYNRGEYDKAVVEFEAVIATIRNKSDPYYQLGMFYAAETHAHMGFAFYKTGDLARAEEEFRRAIEENPRYPDLHYHLGVIYEKQGRLDQAVECLTHAVQINPDYMEAYCYLAIALSEAGKHEQAAKAFEDATRHGLALPLPDTHRLADACVRYLHPPYEELRGAAVGKEDFRELVNAAITSYNNGDVARAAAGFEEAVRLKPEYPDIRSRLAISYGRLERYEDALRELDKAVELNPNYVEALLFRGVYSLKLGRNREACESLRRGVELRPDYWDLRCYLGVACFKRGMFDDATRELSKVTESCPEYSLAHYYLGLTNLSRGRTPEAVASFRVAFEDATFSKDLQRESADIMLETGDYASAIERYGAAIFQNPGYADLHCGLGVAHLARSEFPQAEKALGEALTINPDYAEAHLHMGRVKVELGKEAEAIQHLETAIVLRPGYADLHRELAGRYIAGERYNDAIAELEKAIAINASYVEARLILGLTYRRVDRPAEADKQFMEVLRLDPRNPIARAQLSDLTPLDWQLRKLHA